MGQGDIAVLGNLIPGDKGRVQKANLYAKDDCSVFAFDSIKLRELVANDNKKLVTL